MNQRHKQLQYDHWLNEIEQLKKQENKLQVWREAFMQDLRLYLQYKFLQKYPKPKNSASALFSPESGVDILRERIFADDCSLADITTLTTQLNHLMAGSNYSKKALVAISGLINSDLKSEEFLAYLTNITNSLNEEGNSGNLLPILQEHCNRLAVIFNLLALLDDTKKSSPPASADFDLYKIDLDLIKIDIQKKKVWCNGTLITNNAVIIPNLNNKPQLPLLITNGKLQFDVIHTIFDVDEPLDTNGKVQKTEDNAIFLESMKEIILSNFVEYHKKAVATFQNEHQKTENEKPMAWNIHLRYQNAIQKMLGKEPANKLKATPRINQVK